MLPPFKIQNSKFKILTPIVVILLLWLCPGAAADEIRVGRFWYRDLTIEAIEEGQAIYVLQSGTQLTAPLQRVGAMRIDKYPDLGKAHDALAKKKDDKALSLLKRLDGKVKERWLANWVSYQRMQILLRRGDATGVVNDLVALVNHKADAYYFADPPVKVLAKLDGNSARQLRRKMATTLRISPNLPGAADALNTMIAAAKRIEKQGARPKMPATPPPSNMPPDNGASDKANSRPANPSPADAPPPTTPALDPAQAAIPLPSAMFNADEPDPVARLLHRGQFDQALRQADEQLGASSRLMPRRLYQRGIARLALADQSGNTDAYKTAGLDFMRVIIYSPKSSGYVGASLLEAGYVHMKIGRADLAAKLVSRADRYIGKNEPTLSARLEKLQGQLND